jgi:hypothetical protein
MIFFEPLSKNFEVLKNRLGNEVTLVKNRHLWIMDLFSELTYWA